MKARLAQLAAAAGAETPAFHGHRQAGAAADCLDEQRECHRDHSPKPAEQRVRADTSGAAGKGQRLPFGSDQRD